MACACQELRGFVEVVTVDSTFSAKYGKQVVVQPLGGSVTVTSGWTVTVDVPTVLTCKANTINIDPGVNAANFFSDARDAKGLV